MKRITSLQNPHIKQAWRLRNRREREEQKQFLIEGYREMSRALQAGIPWEALFFCEPLFLQEGEKKIVEYFHKKKIPIYSCSEAVFHKLSYRDRPDGLLGVASFFAEDLSTAEKYVKKPAFVVIAESMEKPGNLGTILRSCDGAGVDLLIVCDPCTDIYNPNVVRASTGTLFTVPVVQASLTETFSFLQEKKMQVYAAMPQAKKLFTEESYLSSTAIVVGCEQYGLTQHWVEKAHSLVQIPMLGEADSLNVAQATTLLLYEVARQRGYGSSLL